MFFFYVLGGFLNSFPLIEEGKGRNPCNTTVTVIVRYNLQCYKTIRLQDCLCRWELGVSEAVPRYFQEDYKTACADGNWAFQKQYLDTFNSLTFRVNKSVETLNGLEKKICRRGLLVRMLRLQFCTNNKTIGSQSFSLYFIYFTIMTRIPFK